MKAKPNSLQHVPDDTLLTLAEVQRYLRCGNSTLRGYISVGRIPTRRVGPRIIRIQAGDLRRWLAALAGRRNRAVGAEAAK